jgi:hypothetical protein
VFLYIYMENVDGILGARYTPENIEEVGMSLEPGALQGGQPVEITIEYAHSTMVVVSTNCPFVDHFLRKVKMCQARNTWINYAHDLKIFFSVLNQPLEHINRHGLDPEKRGLRHLPCRELW